MKYLLKNSFLIQLFNVIFFSLNLLWPIASPIGSSPDELDHIIYAWAVADNEAFNNNNRVPSDFQPGRGPSYVLQIDMPGNLLPLNDLECHRFDSQRPACKTKNLQITAQEKVVVTSAGGYPPFYYFVIGNFVKWGKTNINIEHDELWYFARYISFLLSVMVLLVGASTFKKNQAKIFTIMLIAITPSGTFFSSTINPSGLETALYVSLVAIVYSWIQENKLEISLQSLYIFVLLMATLIFTRPASVFYVFSILIYLLFLYVLKYKNIKILKFLILITTGIFSVGLIVALFTNNWIAVEGDLKDDWGKESLGFRTSLVVLHLLRVPIDAYYLVGWVDTKFPLGLSLFIFIFFIYQIFLFYSSHHKQELNKIFATYILIFTSVFGFFAMLYSGLTWQPRYLLPGIAAFIFLIFANNFINQDKYFLIKLAPFVFFQATAIYWTLGRYTDGVGQSFPYFERVPILGVSDADYETWSPILNQKMFIMILLSQLVLMAVLATMQRCKTELRKS